MRSGGTLQKNRLQRLLSPGGTLSQRVVRGGFWVFALRIVDRLFKLLRTIVLARLLAPKDFGLFGIALLAMSALETFSQTGFQQALIQTKRDIKPYLDTTWTVQAIRGAVLALILFGIAPYVAAFFGEPAAAALLRVLGLSMLFQGFTNIGVVYFQKELEFHKQFVYQLSGTLVDLVVAITAALLLRNAWALIFGRLVGNFVRMVVSYLIHPYRPRLRLEGAKARELYKFGRWILGSSILVFLLNQGDDIFLSKVLGVTALGLYQVAYRISNLPATEITHVISQVTFPAYSKLQDKPEKLRAAYIDSFQITAFLSVPLAGGILFLAPDFTRLFLGEAWIPMVPALQALTLWGLIRSLGAATGPLWQAVGRPQLVTYFQIAKLALLAMLIYPFTIRWGILGTSLAVVAESVMTHLFGYPIVAKTIHCSKWALFRLVAFPLGSTFVMILALFWLNSSLEPVGVLEFFVLLMVGIIVYALGTCLLGRSLGYDIRAVLHKRQAVS